MMHRQWCQWCDIGPCRCLRKYRQRLRIGPKTGQSGHIKLPAEDEGFNGQVGIIVSGSTDAAKCRHCRHQCRSCYIPSVARFVPSLFAWTMSQLVRRVAIVQCWFYFACVKMCSNCTISVLFCMLIIRVWQMWLSAVAQQQIPLAHLFVFWSWVILTISWNC